MAKKTKKSAISQLVTGLLKAAAILVVVVVAMVIYEKIDSIDQNTMPASERQAMEFFD